MPIDYNEFAEKIKAKYPQYKDVDNYTLASKMVEKYPQYQGQVDLKKKRSYGFWIRNVFIGKIIQHNNKAYGIFVFKR